MAGSGGWARSTWTTAHVRDLDDGSWLAHLRRANDRTGEPMLARVIDYTLDDGRENPTVYRLFTTMLDPLEAPADRAGPGLRGALGDHV